MRYSLKRVSDGAGDCGPMSLLLRRNKDTGEDEYKRNARPEVGWQMQVGSPYARTYSWQDYWHCTEITEILEERDNYVRFKTRNSEYEWTQF